MFLLDFPWDIILLVRDHLKDKEYLGKGGLDGISLSLTCRALYYSGAFNKVPSYDSTKWYTECPAFAIEISEPQRDLFKRLLEPGNIFHDFPTTMAVCICCLHYGDKAKRFPIEFKLDGGQLCSDCIALFLLERMEAPTVSTYKGKKYIKCGNMFCPEIWGNGGVILEEEIHRCPVDDGLPLCVECHALQCHYNWRCEGFPEGYARENKVDFCTSWEHISDAELEAAEARGEYIPCGECEACIDIEAAFGSD